MQSTNQVLFMKNYPAKIVTNMYPNKIVFFIQFAYYLNNCYLNIVKASK